MKKYVITLLSAIIFIFSMSYTFWGQSTVSQKNKLFNSSFEEGDLGWTLWNENPGESHGEIDNTLAQSGKNSFYVENSGAGGANLFSDNIPCKPRTMYTISAYIKTKNAYNVFLSAWGLDEDERVINYQINGSVKIPDNLKNFTRFSKTFTTPDNCRILRAHLICHGGMVWWDAVQIEIGKTATDYSDGPGIMESLIRGRKEGRRYTETIIREARVLDLLSQAERLIHYSEEKGEDSGKTKDRMIELQKFIDTIQTGLQTNADVPDYIHMAYDDFNIKLYRCEEILSSILNEYGLKINPSYEPWQPKWEGTINKEKLINTFIIFPCITTYARDYYREMADWGILEPYGFRALNCWITPEGKPGKYDFSMIDKVIKINAGHGYKTDIIVDPAVIVSHMAGEYGKEVYLQTAQGEWSSQGNCHNTINIWHPAVLEMGNDFLKAVGEHYKNNPDVISYELINEPALIVEKQKHGYEYDYVGEGGYSLSARSAWQIWLKNKYNSLKNLNKAWDSRFSDFTMILPPKILTPPLPVSSSQHHPVGEIYDFQLFRAQSHTRYFADCVTALKSGDPNHAIMPQFYTGIIDRKEAALDLLGLATIPEWDIYATHDWPGGKPAGICLYAYSMNRYSKLPYWEDEFIWSQWEGKNTPEPEMRGALERNLWRQIAWGKRGIILFNLDSEWLHDSPDNWNNSILNVEAERKLPRYSTGVIPLVEQKVFSFKDELFKTEITNQELGILLPSSSLLGAAPDFTSRNEAIELSNYLLSNHWIPFFIPEECILDGREDMNSLKVIIAPYATHVPEGLEEKFLAWIKAGGTLICSGPFGLFNSYGFPQGKLLKEIYGIEQIDFDKNLKAWKIGKWNKSSRVTIVKKGHDNTPQILHQRYDKGQILLSLSPFMYPGPSHSLIPSDVADFSWYSHVFTTPDNCQFIRAHLMSYGGMVWWDNIQINAIDKDSGSIGPNLLDNPGFEKGMAGWNFWKENPSESKGSIDKKTTKTGKHSFYINNKGQGGANLYSDNIPCKPNTTYVINAWVKTKAAKGVELACWGLENKDKTLNYTLSDTAPKLESIFTEIIAESIPIKPIECSLTEVELILRNDSKGNYYLFVINLNPAKNSKAEIFLRGKFENIVDLCIGGESIVPVTYKKSTTVLKVHLNPGQGLFFRLGKTH